MRFVTRVLTFTLTVRNLLSLPRPCRGKWMVCARGCLYSLCRTSTLPSKNMFAFAGHVPGALQASFCPSDCSLFEFERSLQPASFKQWRSSEA